jgi:hypothetical protein
MWPQDGADKINPSLPSVPICITLWKATLDQGISVGYDFSDEESLLAQRQQPDLFEETVTLLASPQAGQLDAPRGEREKFNHSLLF